MFQEVKPKIDGGKFVPYAKKFKPDYSLGNNMTKIEILNCINKSKCGKAAGPEDGINAEVYKALRDYLIQIMEMIFNCVLNTETVPPSWRNGTIINLYKGDGSRLSMGNYRGIMLLCILGKLFNAIIANRITNYCMKNGVLNDAQDGFIPER